MLDDVPMVYSGESYDAELALQTDSTFAKEMHRWYPDHWLAFMLCGRPIEDIDPAYVLTIVDTGLPRSDKVSRKVGRYSSEEVVNVGREARRRQQKAAVSGEIDIRQPTSTPPLRFSQAIPEVFTHKIVREVTQEKSNVEKLEENLLKRQRIYSGRTDEKSIEKLRQIEDQLIELYEKEAEGLTNV